MCANHSIDFTMVYIVDVLSPKLLTIVSIIIDMANDMAKNTQKVSIARKRNETKRKSIDVINTSATNFK